MSFIVHPAPLIMKAPTANWLIIKGSGRLPRGAASAVDHIQGHNNSIVPTCLSTRARCRYGLADWGIQEEVSIHDCDERGIKGEEFVLFSNLWVEEE